MKTSKIAGGLMMVVFGCAPLHVRSQKLDDVGREDCGKDEGRTLELCK